MTDQVKHECGIAVIRLLKPLEYYYKNTAHGSMGWTSSTCSWRNSITGARGAGLGTVKLEAAPGNEFIFREGIGISAIPEIFSNVHASFLPFTKEQLSDQTS